MKLPSIHQILLESGRTFRRFPFVLLSAACGTIAAIILIDHEGPPVPTILFGVLLASILGIAFLTALTLLAEKRGWGKGVSFGVQVAGVILLVAYAALVPRNLDGAPAFHIFRFLMLGAALHFLVAFVPYSRKGELTGFWYYNKSLFLRILTAALFTAVLFVGLSLALAALQNLFGIDVPGKRYPELWVFLVGIFGTWFFLAGVPENLAALDSGMEYPKGLKIFAQYILAPIVGVYLVILYAYLAKILFTWDWPKGWVSGLILGFSTAGILSLVLLHPLREREEHRWIRKISGWFVIIMIPLIVMLFLAVWRRISEYGVTEGRYIVCLIGVWLAVMVGYFLMSKGKSIKMIPASLCLFSFLAAFGPWGAFSISEGSQVARLESLLAKNAILVDGKVHKAERSVPVEDAQEISSVLRYLHDIHGYSAIQAWFSESLMDDTSSTGPKSKPPAVVARMLGMELVMPWLKLPHGGFALFADGEQDLLVSGYDRLVRNVRIDSTLLTWSHPAGEFSIQVMPGLSALTIRPEHAAGDTLRIEFQHLFQELGKRGPEMRMKIPPEEMAVAAKGKSIDVKIYFRRVDLKTQGEVAVPTSYAIDLLFRKPEGN